jgi:hypothetical protein
MKTNVLALKFTNLATQLITYDIKTLLKERKTPHGATLDSNSCHSKRPVKEHRRT